MKELQDLNAEEFETYNNCIDVLANAVLLNPEIIDSNKESKELYDFLDAIAALVNRLQIHPDEIKADIRSATAVKLSKLKVH